VTTATFKRIKDFVLALKEATDDRTLIVTPDQLRRRLEATDRTWDFTDAEMMTAGKHLETHGYLKLLQTSTGEQRILLAPELLNNLAASVILEARRNPKGLGSLDERRVLSNAYAFRELEGLALDERDVLLDAMTLMFLEHNICFRETDSLAGQSYLVFPDLINLRRPELDGDDVVEDGAAYTIVGAIENVYASVVVLLGYTQVFTRTDQWRNQARYVVGDGLVCGFRMEGERAGELDFVLYFGVSVVDPVRRLFQSLFESFLLRRDLTIRRYESVRCPRCSALLERAVLRARSREGKTFAFCNDCGSRLALAESEQPIRLSAPEQERVSTQHRIADRRTRFEQAIFRLHAYAQEQEVEGPACFISYAWGDQSHERWVEHTFAKDLQKAGIRVILDRWENSRAGGSVSRFVNQIANAPVVLAVGTPEYFKKFRSRPSASEQVVAAEWDLVNRRLSGEGRVVPILRSGDVQSSLPPLMWGRAYADFRDEHAYFEAALKLILGLYRLEPQDPVVIDMLQSVSEKGYVG
jgi:hypothetical protein